MLHDNLIKLRKSKGLSQEELATRLNVVRQTISKWEQGRSVPDAEMLIRLAEELDTSVNVLLGEPVILQENTELNTIAHKLEILNEQLARHQEHHRKILRSMCILLVILSGAAFLRTVAGLLFLHSPLSLHNASIGVIGGADGPTTIWVSNTSVNIVPIVVTVVLIIVATIGICKTRKK